MQAVLKSMHLANILHVGQEMNANFFEKNLDCIVFLLLDSLYLAVSDPARDFLI